MDRTKRLAIILFIVGVSLVLSGLATLVVYSRDMVPTALQDTSSNSTPLPATLAGTIVNDQGPVAGAIVQVQATDIKTKSDDNGKYTLTGFSGTKPVVLTAWSDGHYIGWVKVDPSAADWKGSNDITITLKSLPVGDNSKYEWYSFDGVEGSAACGMCHREYSEWQGDQHSRSATNFHFLDVYMGTDVNGESGQTVQFDINGKPTPPDPNQPFHGPGYRLDNPSRGGNCATCHTPAASMAPNTQNCTWSGCHTSLTIEQSNGILQYPAVPSVNLKGDAAEGISCEFCHKTFRVDVDPKTGLPYPDMPGILSMQLMRPQDDSQQVFFGTLVDVARTDSYLPLLSQSQFCAGCHYGVFGGVVGMQQVKDGTVIYNSYGEWLNSPYSNPDTGKTCQQCHMPISDANWFVKPEQGGLVRDDVKLHDHTMLGSYDENLLQNTVTMKTDAQRANGQIQVQVSITNDQAGHDVPTDVPIRSVILVVEAVDASGNKLALADGSVNPDFSGDYGGIPGKTFAKVLRDELTGEMPTAAFWRPVTIASDNRIAPMATDISKYTFTAPASGAVTVNVKLVYRRAFYELMQQKGWNDPDILMESSTAQLPAN
jgi:hypothetical protein